MFKTKLKVNIALLLGASMAVACQSSDKQKQSGDQKDTVAHADSGAKKYLSQPLISSIYTAKKDTF